MARFAASTCGRPTAGHETTTGRRAAATNDDGVGPGPRLDHARQLPPALHARPLPPGRSATPRSGRRSWPSSGNTGVCRCRYIRLAEREEAARSPAGTRRLHLGGTRRTRRAPAPPARRAARAGRGSARAATAVDPAPPGREDRRRHVPGIEAGESATRPRAAAPGAPRGVRWRRYRRGRPDRRERRTNALGPAARATRPLAFPGAWRAHGLRPPPRQPAPIRRAHNRPARRLQRARAPRRVHEVQHPAPLRRSHRLQRRAAAHGPRHCAPTTRACVKGRRSPTRRPDGDLRSRRRQRRPAGRPRSHRCVVHRGARAPATSTPPPSGRSHQPTRYSDSASENDSSASRTRPRSTCSLPQVRAASPASAWRPRRACAAAACRSSRSAAACRPAPANRSLSAIARHTSVTRAAGGTAAGGAPGPLPGRTPRHGGSWLGTAREGRRPARGRSTPKGARVSCTMYARAWGSAPARPARTGAGRRRQIARAARRSSKPVGRSAPCYVLRVVDEHEHGGELRGRQRRERQAVRGAGPQHQLNEAMRARHMCAQAENDGRELPDWPVERAPAVVQHDDVPPGNDVVPATAR